MGLIRESKYSYNYDQNLNVELIMALQTAVMNRFLAMCFVRLISYSSFSIARVGQSIKPYR